MPTIADVARRAGVSRTAVSFAFNKPDQLSDETLRRILSVAHELGYYPNPAARSLTTGRTGILGLLIPQRTAIACANPFILEFLGGIGHISDRAGLAILLVAPSQGSLVRAMNNVPVDGFIALGLGVHQREVGLLSRRQVPFVVVDAEAPEGVSSVISDDLGGGEAAATHLLNLGHRDILVVAIRPPRGDDDLEFGDDHHVTHRRLDGYLRAFEARGVAYSRDRVLYADSTAEAGAKALQQVLAAGCRPSAVLAMSDVIAFGVMRAASQAGLRIPDDLSVVGFDDVSSSAMTSPPLTTVRQPIAEKGRIAARLLLDRLSGTGSVARHVLATSLQVRGTVASPRS